MLSTNWENRYNRFLFPYRHWQEIFLIGSNVPTIGGIEAGFKVADEWNCECIQIYTTLSRRWDIKPIPNKKNDEFEKAWTSSSVKQVVSHVPYLVNLASNDKSILEKSVKRLEEEIINAKLLKIPFLVIHPGNYKDSCEEYGINQIAESIKECLEILQGTDVFLLLETMSGQGTQIGWEFEQLARIIDQINYKNIGVCFDTCHVFSAGYAFNTENDYDMTLDSFNRIIGLDKIKVFHLNDSLKEKGSKIDRHAPIGFGKIGLELFRLIINDPRFKEVPKIVEPTDCARDCKGEVALLKTLIKKVIGERSAYRPQSPAVV